MAALIDFFNYDESNKRKFNKKRQKLNGIVAVPMLPGQISLRKGEKTIN